MYVDFIYDNNVNIEGNTSVLLGCVYEAFICDNNENIEGRT